MTRRTVAAILLGGISGEKGMSATMVKLLWRGGRRLLVMLCAATLVTAGGAATAAAAPTDAGLRVATVQESCWTNVFAWVSTFPSNQGNLSSTLSCLPAVPRISIRMKVFNWPSGTLVTTVGPVVNFNSQQAGVAYSWWCTPSAPVTRYGELFGEVTYANGQTASGTWYTQLLSC